MTHLFMEVPPLYVVAFTIFILLMSFMSAVWYIYLAMKELGRFND
jgi:hypothetical protein